MNKLFLLLLPFSLFADIFILDEVTIKPTDVKPFTVITFCNNNKEFIYVTPWSMGNPQFTQVFEESGVPSRCQQDFKHSSQFPKD